MNHLATAIGLFLGLAVGLLAAGTDIAALDSFTAGVAPLGTLFINAVRMVVIPLVTTTVFVAVARLGDPRKVGKLGGSALAFFFGTAIPAVLMGVLFMKGALRIWPVTAQVALNGEPPAQLPSLVDFFVSLVPANPFAALANGSLLPILIFTVVMALGAGMLPNEGRQRLITLADDISTVFVHIINWVLWTAPVGVFALAAPVMARMGLGLLQSLLVFVGTVAVGVWIFMIIFYLPAIKIFGKMSPMRFIRGVVGTYTLGFSTTSSIAAFPAMFKDAEGLGVSPEVSSLVLPLGASVNRAGSALFQAAAVVFLAALSGVTLSPGALASAGVVVFLVSMTVPPVPSASIVTLAPALEAAGVPLTGLAILLGIDRIPDMFRSATNITGHVAGAVIVDGLMREGEESVDTEPKRG